MLNIIIRTLLAHVISIKQLETLLETLMQFDAVTKAVSR